MLIIFKLIIVSGFSIAFPREYKIFKKTVPSKSIFPTCSHIRGDENGIFTLSYKTKNLNHIFYIMKGIPVDTCFDHVRKIKKIKRTSHMVTISGDYGELDNKKKNEMSWTLKFVKTNKDCDSHLANYCYPDGHPDKMD